MEAIQEELKLVIHLEYEKPIELESYINSLKALLNLYSSENKNIPKNERKLFIKTIKEGSLITEILPNINGLFQETIALILFFNNLVDAVKYFKSGKDKKKEYSKKELQNYNDIVDPIAKDASAKSSISLQNMQGSVFNNCTFYVASNEANAIQNRISEELKPLPSEGIYYGVYFRWDTTNHNGKKTNKIIVEDIVPNKSLKVTFRNKEEDFYFTTSHKEGYSEWQFLSYKSDIKTIVINDKIVAYEVLRVYKDLENNDVLDITDNL